MSELDNWKIGLHPKDGASEKLRYIHLNCPQSVLKPHSYTWISDIRTYCVMCEAEVPKEMLDAALLLR